jgi:uncharacterized membrane protein (UPF0182 family)
VIFGQLQMVPVGQGLVWVRPLYVRPDDTGSKQVFVRRVLAWHDGEAVIGNTLTEAIGRLFPNANVDLGEITDTGSSEPDTTDPGTTDPDTTDPGTSVTDPAALLEEAQSLFDEADAALRDGDLGAYQDKVGEAQDLIAQALQLLGE